MQAKQCASLARYEYKGDLPPYIHWGTLQLRQKNMQGTVWWVSQAWASQAKAEGERFLCPFESQCSGEGGQDNVDTLHKAH